MEDLLTRLKTSLADRYAIERPLGAGAMARVYLAHDIRHDRTVAVKVLNPELSETLGVDRFLREIKIAARLHHPNILPVHDSGEADELMYYVMPVATESLRQWLRRDTIVPLQPALAITHAVLGALDYAHVEGIVHRDIKPENILLSRGHATVADFGIARLMNATEATKLTKTGMQIGTPAYMSPEQASAQPELDGRTDIFSVACVLCEMLTGERPKPWKSLEQAREPVPTAVAEAVRRALAPNAAERFDTAADFAAALSPTPVDGFAFPIRSR